MEVSPPLFSSQVWRSCEPLVAGLAPWPTWLSIIWTGTTKPLGTGLKQPWCFSSTWWPPSALTVPWHLVNDVTWSNNVRLSGETDSYSSVNECSTNCREQCESIYNYYTIFCEMATGWNSCFCYECLLTFLEEKSCSSVNTFWQHSFLQNDLVAI